MHVYMCLGYGSKKKKTLGPQVLVHCFFYSTNILQLVHDPQVTWIPSHLDEAFCEDAFEDWIRENNDQADKMAGHMNHQRSSSLWHCREQLLQHHAQTLQTLGQLARFYFALADNSASTSRTSSSEGQDSEPGPLVWDVDRPLLSEHFPLDVRKAVDECCRLSLPREFILLVLSWISSEEMHAEGVYDCTYLEFALLWHLLDQPFPQQIASTGEWQIDKFSLLPTRPTLASVVGVFRKLLRSVACLFDGYDPTFSSKAKGDLGITCPVAGIFLGLTSEHVLRTRACVRQFTRGWPVRRAADMARPLQ